MAYFSNSTDGAAFEHQCSMCKLSDSSCPIAAVQFNYNYDAVNNEVATKILGGLVKDNGQCLMYAEIEKAWDGKPVASTESKCNKHIVSGSAVKNNEFSLFLKNGDAVVVRGNDVASAIKSGGYKSKDVQCWAFYDCIHEFYYDNEINRWLVKDEGEEY